MAEDEFRTPRPDPTLLTTAQLNHEVAILKELIEAKLLAIVNIIDLQRDKIERNTLIVDKVPVLDNQIKTLGIMFQHGVEARKEQVHDQITNIQEASHKQEATFAKQIDQLGTVINALGKGLDDKIDDLKTRVQALEARPTPAGVPTVLILGTIAMAALMAAITAIVLHETSPSPSVTEVHERVAP